MEIFKKNNIKNISSIRIEYDNINKKKIPHFKPNWLKEPDSINPAHNGFYIKTGKKNNITVIDIDNINLDHNKKLIELINNKCITLSETTQKGLHYYFKYNAYLDSSVNSALKIDILNDNKCVFCAPTIIKTSNKNIEYRILQDVPINELHKDVIDYIMELKSKLNIKESASPKPNKKIKNKIKNKIKSTDKYFITADELASKLNKLSAEYLNDYNKWIILLSLMKNLDDNNLYEIFDEWSKKSPKYNRVKNLSLYNSNKGMININYLNYLVQDKKIFSHQNLTSMKNLNKNIKVTTLQTRYLDLSHDDTFKYKTIIIKSDTGTGKTTTITKNMKQIKEKNQDLRIISLVSRISLSHQHIKNFKQHNINLALYQDINKSRVDEYENQNIVCCINSLLLLKDFEFENTILFIDEIDSFIQSIVDNATLKDQKQIYALLMKMINKCNTLILSDATINDVVFKFCERRNDKNKIFINNKFKSNQSTKAIQCNDENEFMQLMSSDIANKKYFLACSDKAEKITELYSENLKNNNKDDFVLITADSKIQILDAQEEFKNKFIYYSPSITYGVDYNNAEKQNVYIYITGCSISPIGLYQQINRTRNIDKVYFYINPAIKHDVIKYETIEATEQYFRNAIDNFENVLPDICTVFKDDKLCVEENSFFKLFCHNEYVKNIYNNNKESHFKKILQKRGFQITTVGEYKKISKDFQKALKEAKAQNVDEQFMQYIQDPDNGDFEDYEKRRKFLNIPLEEVVNYKEFIVNKYEFENHLDIIDFFKTDNIINDKIKELNENKFKEVIYNHKFVKIRVMRDILKKYNIAENNLNYGDKNQEIKLDENDNKLINTTFRIKSTIKNLYEFNKMHLSMIRNICQIIISKQIKKNGVKFMHYEYNNELIEKHKLLAEFRKNIKNEVCAF